MDNGKIFFQEFIYYHQFLQFQGDLYLESTEYYFLLQIIYPLNFWWKPKSSKSLIFCYGSKNILGEFKYWKL